MQPGGGGLRNRGFTLIELLAVIIILVVIALISVPIILNIIENARKSAFLNIAYGLIESAKSSYMENLLDGTSEIRVYAYPFEDLKFSGSKPKGGIIRIDEQGSVEIAIHNNKWCASNNKNDSKVTLNRYEEGKCTIKDSAKDPVITLNGEKEITLKVGESYQELGVIAKTVDGEKLEYTVEITLDGNKVESIDTNHPGIYKITYQVNSNGKTVTTTRIITVVETEKTFLEVMERAVGEVASLDPDGNPRYVGADPNNYVSFNNELWRIIGVFDGQTKIIRNENYSEGIEWDKNAYNGWHGDFGYNDWSRATLKVELNTTFLGSIDSTSKSLINQSYSWKLGGWNTVEITRSVMYEKERGTTVYTDRPTTWTGAIGLMYPSDYGYATSSTEEYCNTANLYNWYSSIYSDCRNKDWLYDSVNSQWTLTPYSNGESDVFDVLSYGGVNRNNAYVTYYVARPVLFLKSSVKIKTGEGTKTNPFILGT